MATCLAWNAGHALAVTSVTGEQSQRYREELEQLIKARMKPGERALPELRSSPAVQELRSKLVKAESAVAPGGNARNAADAAELEQLRRKLEEALRNEDRLKQQLLEESKRQAPAVVVPVQQAPSLPVTPVPAPSAAQQTSSTAAEKPSPKPAVEVAPDATAPVATRAPPLGVKEEASGFSLLNGLGIVAAGGLGGFLYLQKGEQARLEAEQDAQRARQRAEVVDLSSQVNQAKEALSREQRLKEQLREQLTTAAEESKRQAKLEADARAAVEVERALVQRALEAERRTAEAARAEAAAAAEAVAAERAAKFAADSEARELARELAELETALTRQREFAARVGADAHKAQADLQAAQEQKGKMFINNSKLSQALEKEEAEREAALAEVARLETLVKAASKESADATNTLEAVGKQNLDMRRAMTIMKEQAAEMAVKAQAAASAAADERAAADEKLAAANDALSMERAKIVALQGELASTNAELARSSADAEELRMQLSKAVAESGKLRSDIAKLTEETAIVERKLAAEVSSNKVARAENASLRSELGGLRSQLSETSKQLEAERATSGDLEAQVAQLKREYTRVGDQLESEQTRIMQVEGEANSLKKLTESLEGRTQALTDQLVKQRSDYAQRLFEAQQEVNQVKSEVDEERAGREDATAAVLKMQSIIQAVREEMVEAQLAADEAQEALEEERTARVEAEALAARLRSQLSGLREAQTSQQASAQQRLAALQAHLASLASRVDPATGAVRSSALEGLDSMEDTDAGEDVAGNASEGSVVEEDALQQTTVT